MTSATIMTEPESGKSNPFQWYLGKSLSLQGRAVVVEDCEVRGRDLSIRVRDADDGTVQRISPLELISAAPG